MHTPNRLRQAIIAISAWVLFVPTHSASAANKEETHFETKIRPVLMGTCFKCHGGDKTANNLRVDGRDHLTRGGKSGAAVVPGDADGSRLIRAIRRTHDDLKMPPTGPLPASVVKDFERWVNAGAPWPNAAKPTDLERAAARHWSFQPIRDTDLQTLPGDAGAHPIDRFIIAGQRAAKTKPVGPAARQALIRRATFDLTGLPPTPTEVEAFVNDKQPGAFERVIDRLLASPRYGERWGRHWLDLVRYADTAGDDSDYPIPQAYLYRDYVIDAFNADTPYDRFIHEQLAGDILAKQGAVELYRQRVIATGYIAQAKRFATHKHEDMHLIIEDTLSTTGQVMLGMTLRCARCHDHKYDPVSMDDYYGLYGFFRSVVYPHAGSEEVRAPSDLVPLIAESELAAAEKAYLAKHGKRLAELDGQIKHIEKTVKDKKARDQQTAPLKKQIAEIKSQNPRSLAPVAYAIKEGKPVDVKLQIAGNPKRTGKVVPRGMPRVVRGKPIDIPSDQSGRLQLAQWMTDPANPLTSRVMVNRIWQYHFGKGLVATPSNFGIQGSPPTHPRLLDWLALRFIDSGWSIKAMHKLIMTSQTYQRSAEHDTANADRDPANRTYWRFDRRRLDAESIRDTMLLLGGNLDLNRPGPHPFPPKEKWRYSAHRQFKAVYPSKHRSVYLMVQRLHPHPYFALFNGPDTTATTPVRDNSTLPLQALFMANGQFVKAQASGLAQQLITSQDDTSKRIDLAYKTMYARPATDAERGRASEYLKRYSAMLEAEGMQANERELQAWSSLVRVMFASNEFIYVD